MFFLAQNLMNDHQTAAHCRPVISVMKYLTSYFSNHVLLTCVCVWRFEDSVSSCNYALVSHVVMVAYPQCAIRGHCLCIVIIQSKPQQLYVLSGSFSSIPELGFNRCLCWWSVWSRLLICLLHRYGVWLHYPSSQELLDLWWSNRGSQRCLPRPPWAIGNRQINGSLSNEWFWSCSSRVYQWKSTLPGLP